MLTYNLVDLSLDHVVKVGRKAATLGMIARAGLSVPPGFVLTAQAYRLFVERNELGPALQTLAASAERERTTTAVQAAASEIEALFQQAAIPAEIADAVQQAHAKLGAVPVAVRSTATAEDLATVASAGQYESYLNVQPDGVLAAINACWTSLWHFRAQMYRLFRHIPTDGLAMAVLIQQMVPAEAAGVMFTAHPVTGARGQTVIEAVPGQGEALVSGKAAPDHWEVETATGAPLLTHAPLGLLSAGQIAELTRVGARLSAQFGAPQDIEWALADGRFHVLQSRPIANLS